ncbi:hypothetical protein GGR54DRAFT_623453 [Hypoxylon sp. NC1633]|nr:hypothetical protein GGR54DRAFT_623453 [Hypoxylon sp. NC1633]
MSSIHPSSDASTEALSNALDQTGDAFGVAFRNAGICLTAVAALFVTVRVANSCSRGNRWLLVDDSLAVIALLLLAGFSAMSYVAANEVQGSGNETLSPTYFAQQSVILTVLARVSMFFSKAPIITLYLRIFGIKTWLRIVCYTTLALLLIYYVVTLSVVGAACSQGNGAGDPNFIEKCIGTTISAGIANGATAVITDIIIMILPLPIIAKLMLPFRQKIGLALIFLTGAFATTASVISLYFKTMSLLGQYTNMTAALFCGTIECSLTIMVSCAPAIHACWSRYVSSHVLYAKLQSAWSSFKICPRVGRKEEQDYAQLH